MVKLLNIKQGKLIKWYKLRCSYCGNEKYVPYFYLVLRHIFRRKIYNTCEKCYKTTCYETRFDTVTDHDKKERDMNIKYTWDKRLCK